MTNVDKIDVNLQISIDLWILDAMLTGKDSRSGRGAEWPLVDAEKFACGQLYYLSDGGYSRVFYDPTSRKLMLTSESLDSVRQHWSKARLDSVKYRIELACRHATA